MTDKKLKMNAYYYGFEETGNRDIDLILHAVALAGKAFHHTDSWNDELGAWGEDVEGNTPVEWIQNAAIRAAKSSKQHTKGK